LCFYWNLACVPFGHEFLVWDSFSHPWFVNDDRFDPISLMVHSIKSGQSMYEFDLDSKAGLLGACIGSDFGYINEYKFGSHEIQS
jgi:hypothetical protein